MIQVDSVAPFYKLNPEGTVYMQVVKMGNASAATNGEKIYFRFLRYNLLSYLENGVLPQGQGNANDPTESTTFFEVGSDKPSTTQWGTAIQMPILLGLPIDSEVNLVVASEAGPTSEISGVIPFLYDIRYYKSAYINSYSNIYEKMVEESLGKCYHRLFCRIRMRLNVSHSCWCVLSCQFAVQVVVDL